MSYQPAKINDLKLLLRNTLLKQDSITDIVGDRIHGGHLQNPDADSAEYPLVVVSFTSGSVGFSSGYQQVSMELWAYSRRSAGRAAELYDACFAAVHHQGLREDSVNVAGYAAEILRPEEGWNEKIRAYYAQGMFSLRVSYRNA